MKRGSRFLLGIAVSVAFAAAVATQASALTPFQMVRSLQLVQDALAAGDHAALPMQRKLLEMIDARLRAAPKEEFEDIRNLRAVLVYGVSGGNPQTVEIVLSRLGIAENDPVASGVLGYLQGRTDDAMRTLGPIDPMTQEFELGAFLALVKGTVVAGQDEQAGLAFLDQARLLAPGTLVEESALRRTISLSASLNDPARFLRGSSQYVRRFLRSPYASQFADAFVAGAVSLHAALDPQLLAAIISQMSQEHQRVIYLRLARMGMIDGLAELSAFAAVGAARIETGMLETGDPRAALYSSIASVTSDSVGDVAAKLKAIDRAMLSDGDRKLLDAAEAIAAEVLSAPAALENPVVEISAAPEPEAGADATPAAPGAEAPPEPVRVIVDEARKRLAEIDKLLGKATK